MSSSCWGYTKKCISSTINSFCFVNETNNFFVCFRSFILELCAGTIRDFCDRKYPGSMPRDHEALRQMASGLLHIHNNNFIHRDIKPENILISLPSDSSAVQLKISDFGLCKPTTLRGSASISSVKGTYRWLAPELLPLLDEDEKELVTRQCKSTDIFALGCVFFYYATRGRHPFGEEVHSVTVRISDGDFDLSGKRTTR